MSQAIDTFLDGGPHAVVGASRSRSKYGNKVLRSYLQNDRPVFAVNPNCSPTTKIEGQPVYSSLADLPEPVHGISIITPPEVTEDVVEEAVEAGIRHIWMQPGAESNRAIARAEDAGISVISGGPCLLVSLGFRESA